MTMFSLKLGLLRWLEIIVNIHLWFGSFIKEDKDLMDSEYKHRRIH